MANLIPQPLDVLFGRGRKIKTWEGNQRFLEYTSKRWHLRLGLRDQDKLRFSEQVVNAVHAWGGRFLEEDADGWHLVDSTRALRKVSQRFRDLRSQQIKKGQKTTEGPLAVARTSMSTPLNEVPRHGSARTVSFDVSDSSPQGLHRQQSASAQSDGAGIHTIMNTSLGGNGDQLDNDFVSIWLEDEFLGGPSGQGAHHPSDSTAPMQRSKRSDIDFEFDPLHIDFADDASFIGSLIHTLEDLASDNEPANDDDSTFQTDGI